MSIRGQIISAFSSAGPSARLVDLGEVNIVRVEVEGDDGLIVTFSDGTISTYAVEGLLELRAHRELMEPSSTRTDGESRVPTASAKHRRIVVGSVIQFGDKNAAVCATSALRRDINMANVRSKGKPLTLSQLADHYGPRELASSNRWKTHSTKMGYRGYLRKWIIPRWGGYTLAHIRAGEIELWLRSLADRTGE